VDRPTPSAFSFFPCPDCRRRGGEVLAACVGCCLHVAGVLVARKLGRRALVKAKFKRAPVQPSYRLFMSSFQTVSSELRTMPMGNFRKHDRYILRDTGRGMAPSDPRFTLSVTVTQRRVRQMTTYKLSGHAINLLSNFVHGDAHTTSKVSFHDSTNTQSTLPPRLRG
jgi:hypothetical protein